MIDNDYLLSTSNKSIINILKVEFHIFWSDHGLYTVIRNLGIFSHVFAKRFRSMFCTWVIIKIRFF